jgi:Ca2+-dependent lipid-binding protein
MLLHGWADVWADVCSPIVMQMLRHIACVQAAQKLVTRELGAFVEVEIAGDVLAKTNSKLDSRREPVWNEAFMIDVCHKVKHIRLRVCTLCMHV